MPFCMAVLDITSNYNQSSMYYKWETKIQNGNNGNIWNCSSKFLAVWLVKHHFLSADVANLLVPLVNLVITVRLVTDIHWCQPQMLFFSMAFLNNLKDKVEWKQVICSCYNDGPTQNIKCQHWALLWIPYELNRPTLIILTHS